MICFRLCCADGHEFEGWFRNSDTFEEQARTGDLGCPVCGDRQVQKAIMAPAIARSTAPVVAGEEPAPKLAQMLRVMRAIRDHVEANFDDVGERFPEEVRKMHYGELEHRDVYGQASREAVGELLDEGIQIHPLPVVPKLDG